jgi:hypothetical protein
MAKSGKGVDYEALARNFESGAELKRLQAELRRSQASAASSRAFILGARGEMLK